MQRGPLNGWVLSGGEDHSLAATFPPGTRLPPRWRVIGGCARVMASSSTASRGREAPGWDHFA